MKIRLLISLLAVLAMSCRAESQIRRAAEMNTEELRALHRSKTVVLIPGGVLTSMAGILWGAAIRKCSDRSSGTCGVGTPRK